MQTPQKILVVISGKRKQHEALLRALKFAELNEVHIHLLNVIYEPILDLTDVLSSDHRKEMKKEYLADRYLYLNTIAEDLEKKNIRCTTHVQWCREVHEGIEDAVSKIQPDLVIKRITADSMSINPFAMPIDRHLLRYCKAPLLLVKHATWTNAPILAAVDVLAKDDKHVALNQDILEAARLFAQLGENEIHTVSAYLVHNMSAAIDFPTINFEKLSANSAQFHSDKLDSMEKAHEIPMAKKHVVAGMPEKVIPNVVKQIDAGLVILGTVARKGISAAFLGNTAESILAELNCEVLALNIDESETE
ncbi:universal stress protein UspE [Aliiglaciecola sp. SL4]|uniref:universal stress protein UspE n=1 Tax=Aliiglaciecola sp. SL4 TaxID=3239806 RepID=UPI00355B80F4